jgi:hypothetical protein
LTFLTRSEQAAAMTFEMPKIWRDPVVIVGCISMASSIAFGGWLLWLVLQ